MVAVLILHGRSDLDWATALANDLPEHAPVRVQVGATPSQVMFGPSVVRVALWSDESEREGIGGAMSALISASAGHSMLVRRYDCAPPADLDVSRLAGNFIVADPREAAVRLRPAIPHVAVSVEKIAIHEIERVQSTKDKRLQMLDTLSLLAVLGLLGAAAWMFDWAGLRATILSAIGR